MGRQKLPAFPAASTRNSRPPQFLHSSSPLCSCVCARLTARYFADRARHSEALPVPI